MNNDTQVRAYSGPDSRLPPPGYLVATDHNGTRLVARGDQAQRRPPTIAGDVLPPVHQVDTPMPVQSRQTLTGTYQDRALGFRIAMLPVAVVAGLLAVVAAVALFSVPILSGAVLAWFLTAFCATWLIGFFIHTWASPDGTALTMVLLHYRLLRHEQKARIERMSAWGDYDGE